MFSHQHIANQNLPIHVIRIICDSNDKNFTPRSTSNSLAIYILALYNYDVLHPFSILTIYYYFHKIGAIYAHWSHGGNDSSDNTNRNA